MAANPEARGKLKREVQPGHSVSQYTNANAIPTPYPSDRHAAKTRSAETGGAGGGGVPASRHCKRRKRSTSSSKQKQQQQVCPTVNAEGINEHTHTPTLHRQLRSLILLANFIPSLLPQRPGVPGPSRPRTRTPPDQASVIRPPASPGRQWVHHPPPHTQPW